MKETANHITISSRPRPPEPAVINPLKTINPSSDTLFPFSNSLHRSLDVKAVLSTSLSHLSASFSIVAAKFNASGTNTTWEAGQQEDLDTHSTEHFIIETEHERLGYLTLTLQRPLAKHEYIDLCGCLVCLIYPLKNSLQYHTVLQQTLTDPLTGCGNRLALENFLTDQWNSFERYHHNFSLLMIDIDHFKAVNDNFGHHTGDQVLIRTTEILKANLRSTDRIFRYGGEEFLAVLPHTKASGCRILAERLRTSIASIDCSLTHQNITVSIGCATSAEYHCRYETLIQQADIALYTAKRKGRNRVEMEALEKVPL